MIFREIIEAVLKISGRYLLRDLNTNKDKFYRTFLDAWKALGAEIISRRDLVSRESDRFVVEPDGRSRKQIHIYSSNNGRIVNEWSIRYDELNMWNGLGQKVERTLDENIWANIYITDSNRKIVYSWSISID